MALQIRDLLLGIGDLLFAFSKLAFPFGYLTAEFFVLSQQPLIFPVQMLTAGLGWLACQWRFASALVPPVASRSRFQAKVQKNRQGT